MLKYFNLFVQFIFFTGFLSKCLSDHITQSRSQKKQVSVWKNYTYLEVGDSFYHYHMELKNWHDAKEVCAQERAILFYPETKDEADAVISFWKLSTKNRPKFTPIWTVIFVGISDIETEGVFVTVDGRTDMYLNWREGQPDNWKDDEDCLELSQEGEYNDLNCLDEREFICKKRVSSLEQNCSITTVPSLEQNSSTSNIQPFNLFPFISLNTFVFWPNSTVPFCNDPAYLKQKEQECLRMKYTFIEAGWSCYKFHRKSVTWHTAITVCADEGAHLFYLDNKDEADAVISFWKQYIDETRIYRLYVGITDIKTEGVYETIDGKSITEVYHKWDKTQPHNGSGEDCLVLTPEGFYRVAICEVPRTLMCKKRLTRNCITTCTNIQPFNLFGTYPESKKTRVRSGDLHLDRNSFSGISLKTFVFWPNATVPFYIDPDHFDNEQASVILKSLAMFGFKTCIKFASVTSAPSEGQHVMTFINPEGVRRCRIETKGHSNYNPHLILLGYECLNTLELDMIIMRALGLPFEHNRASRDVYIDVLIENIEPNYIQLFTKDSILPRPLRDIPYDHNSIMHFGERDYSKNGHVTIKFKYRRFRQDRNGLTPGDTKKIELIYGPECRIRDRAQKIAV